MSRMRSRIAHEAYADTSIPGGGKGCKSRKEERSFLREIFEHVLVVNFCYNENLTETLVNDSNKSIVPPSGSTIKIYMYSSTRAHIKT